MVTLTRHSGTRVVISLVTGALVVMLASGCARLTSVEPQGQPSPYEVGVKIDPVTLAPPQTSSLTFSVTDTSTGKPVIAFEQLSGALMHTVLISRDLQYFYHSYTQVLVDNAASLSTYFPGIGSYYNYTLFQPAGKPVQTFKTIIQTGDVEGSKPTLVEDLSAVKTNGWLTFRLLKQSGPIKRGTPTQLVFNLTERGNPVTAVWSYLGAPGQIWVIAADGNDFAHVEGASEANILPTPQASTPQATSESTGGGEPAGSSTTGGTGAGGIGQGGTRSGFGGTQVVETPEADQTPSPSPTFAPPPTFAPGLQGPLASATAAPTQQLAPVQQTPQAYILSTPEVQPTTSYGYGPNIAFTHTFPRAGLYKVWLEVLYRGQVVLADYVLRVAD